MTKYWLRHFGHLLLLPIYFLFTEVTLADNGVTASEGIRMSPDLLPSEHSEDILDAAASPRRRAVSENSGHDGNKDCDCDVSNSKYKGLFESYSSPQFTKTKTGTGLTQSCKECHENKETGFHFEDWMEDQKQWEDRIVSLDPIEKAKTLRLLSQLYGALVDSQNMPPQSEPEKRANFHAHPGAKPFIDFLTKKHLALNPNENFTIAPNKVRLMSEETEKKYRDLIPKTESARLNSILNNPNLIFLDKKHMVPGYQDPSLPVAGERSTEPGFRGSGFAKDAPFIDNNGHLKLWSQGFGIEKTPNAETFHFLQLPQNTDGTLQKIKVTKQRTPQPDGGLLYNWEFPVGTVSGEVILGRNSKGEKFVLQIRTRTKDQAVGPWASDIFKPFPTVQHFRDKLQELSNSRQELAQEARRVLEELKKPGRLKEVSLGMHGYQVGDLDSKGGTEVLPEMSEALTQALLKEPFKSSLGAEWDKDSSVTAFAPTSNQPFSLVSQHNNEGALMVGRKNCGQCHQDSNKPIRDFYLKSHPKYYSSIVAYANTPGSDQNLRFNIFDQGHFQSFGGTGVNDNRVINPKLFPILDVK